MIPKYALLSVALVIGLIAGFGATYAYSANQISSLQTSLSQANESNMTLHEEMQNATSALSLSLKSGQMIHSGWVLISPVGSGDYAISLHAEGLEPPSSGGYIVEGVTRQGMNMVPISGNATGSEFDASTGGIGNYWTVIMQNPHTAFEAIDLLYLPGMQMSGAVVVASVALG